LSRDDLLLGFFYDNGPSSKLSKNWSSASKHPTIHCTNSGANKEKMVWRYLLQISSGLLWLHQNRRFRSFTFVGVTCMGGVWPRLIQYVFILGGENGSDNDDLELMMVIINHLKD